MSTTTIRLDEDLKTRVAVAADRAGKTTHAFILDAIAQTVSEAEQEAAFLQLADDRWDRLLTSGQTVPWSDAKRYLEDRAAGARPTRPLARSRTPDTGV